MNLTTTITLCLTILFFQSLFGQYTAQVESNGVAAHGDAVEIITSKEPLIDTEKELLIRVQRVMAAMSSLHLFSGVMVLSKDGNPVYKYLDGFANLDYNVPNNLECKFNTCAITETFTAIAIMQLYEKGMINLYAPIKTYLPELPSEIGDILTVHHLLSHTSGLLDYYQIPEYREHFLQIGEVEDVIKLLAMQDRPCNTNIQQPSSSAYLLLAAIIERLSGETYPDYIREHILKPADLKNSDLHTWSDVVYNKAVGYMPSERGNLISDPDFWGAYPFGSDGVFSTGEDIIKFNSAIYSGRLVKESSLKLMTSNYDIDTTQNKKDQHFGYGLQTKRINNVDVTIHGGKLNGLSSQLRHYGNGYTFAILCNMNHNTAEMIAEKLEKAIIYDDYIVLNEPIAFYLNEVANEKGVPYIIDNFEQILNDYSLKLDFVWTLNALGNEYLYQKRFDDAAEIFKLNSRKFPNELIVYDSLGEVYFQQKQYDLAIHYFEIKLQLSPKDLRAKNTIKEIKKLQEKAKNNPRPLVSQ